jgi:phosphoesterase RecJ-like protein
MTAKALNEQKTVSGSIKRVLNALERYRKILITAHMRPDGDATGSAIAMARLLQAHGWETTVSLSPVGMGPPKFLLDYANCIAPTNIKVKDYEAILVLDCAGRERLPEGHLREAVDKLPVICIDHHVIGNGKPFGVARWIVTTASSTGELVYQFAKRLKWEIDLHTAEALWVAIVTDTGRYAYSCTKPSTLRTGADLLACGIDASAINDRLFLYASEGAVLLKRKAYDSLTTWFRGKVALICLTARDFKRAGVAKSEIEDAIDIPRSIPTAKISLFFYETKDKRGITRLSIRTRGDDERYSSASIANHFGGGGHLRAAGCEIALPPKQAIEQVKAYLAEILDN